MIRRVLFWCAVLLFIGWIAKNPGAAERMGAQLGDAGKHAATAIGTFFTHLTA